MNNKRKIVGVLLLTAVMLVCGAVVILSAGSGTEPAVLTISRESAGSAEDVVSSVPSAVLSSSPMALEIPSDALEATSSAVTTSSEDVSAASSKTSSVMSSKTSSAASSKTSSAVSSKTSSAVSSKTSSAVSSKTSSAVSSKTSSAVSSKTSSAVSSEASPVSAAVSSVVTSSKTLSEIFSERIEIFNDPAAFAEVMDDYTNSYWSDGFMKYLISYANTLEYTPPADPVGGAYTPTATQAERIAMLKQDTVTVRVGGSTKTVTYYEALKLIVANELSYGYDEETLKAQMVCAYTFLRYHAGCGRIPTVGFASQLVQETRWGAAGMAQIERLIAEVGGLLVTVDGHPAFTTYGALSNGKTNTVQDAWGGNGIDNYGTAYNDYMPSVDSPWCTRVKKYETTPTFPAAEVRRLLEEQFNITLSENKANWIKVIEYNPAGYGMDVVIDGQKKTTAKTLRDEVFNLSKVGYNLMLRSFSYTVEYLPETDQFRFVVHGYGHGVGLSQYGAEELAKEGKNWRQIIKIYFPGVTVPEE